MNAKPWLLVDVDGPMNIDENFYWHDGGRELNPYRKEDNHD